MFRSLVTRLMPRRLCLSLMVLISSFCSVGAQEAERPTVRFSNNKAISLNVYFAPKGEERSLVGELKPGQTLSQRTTVGHRFLITDQKEKLKVPFVVRGESENLEFGPTHSTFRIRGWKIHLNDDLWAERSELTRKMLELLDVQLDRVVKVVPEKPLKHLKTVPVWLSPPYDDERPTAAYHPSAAWLKKNGRLVEMAKSVEITNVDRFEFENKRMPYLMLHELAHAYHDQVLGFRNPKIRAVFEKAKSSGGYDNVDRFTGRKMVKDKAYAMSNPREYFAESTEAFFGKNDFFPFDRTELKKHDPEMFVLLKELWVTNE